MTSAMAPKPPLATIHRMAVVAEKRHHEKGSSTVRDAPSLSRGVSRSLLPRQEIKGVSFFRLGSSERETPRDKPGASTKNHLTQ